jgi:hypothetical protein
VETYIAKIKKKNSDKQFQNFLLGIIMQKQQLISIGLSIVIFVAVLICVNKYFFQNESVVPATKSQYYNVLTTGCQKWWCKNGKKWVMVNGIKQCHTCP